jgi:pimeloyl-ACP methyl ester carboxylesterase
MKKVYFISGLGADKRVFSFLDLSFCEPIFIEWITPLKKESLESYALRLSKNIPEINPTIVGISFGGMLAIEIAKANPDIKAIIISSNKTSAELPNLFRIGKYLPVYRWLPDFLLKQIALSFKWVLGGKGNTQKKLLRQIINDTDISFLKWAIRAILNWKNNQIPDNLIHVHGSADKLLPIRLVKPNYRIEDGSHVMPMDKPEEIAILLKQLI